MLRRWFSYRASFILLGMLTGVLITPCLQAQTGVFVDRDGHRHPWSITRHNALIWDGKPYLPFGGMFVSTYLRAKTDRALARDQKALKLIRSQGINDLYVNAMWNPSPAVMQRLIDLLQKDGFRYGLQLPVHARSQMTGYRITASQDEMLFKAPGTATLILKGAKQALYVVVNAQTGKLITSGAASVSDQGTCRITVNTAERTNVLVKCSPRIVISNWIADNADKITAWLRQLHFSSGLRFFLDPIQNEYGTPRHFLAASHAARVWVAHFLKRRYGSTTALAKAWGIKPEAITSFDQAARLVPIVAGPKNSYWKHLGYVIDSKTHQVLPVNMTVCRMWLDLTMAESLMLNQHLDRVCNQIHHVVDVPVVTKRHHQATLVWPDRKPTGGLDGLGMEAYGTGSELAYFNAAATYAAIAQSKRNMWCLVTESNCAQWHQNHIAYRTRQQMYRDFNLLLRQGAKGIFMFGLKLRAGAEDNRWTIFSLHNDPKQMRWIADFAAAARADTQWIHRSPNVAFVYPTENSDAAAFLRSDMPVYGLSGTWAGRRGILTLGPGKWAAPVYNPIGLKHVIVKPGVLNNPVLSFERNRLKKSGVTPIRTNWTANGQVYKANIPLAANLTDGFKPVVRVTIHHDVAPGVVALTWRSSQYGPVVRLEATGPTKIVRISSKHKYSVQVNRHLRSSWHVVRLPATLVLPYTSQQKKHFALQNARFGIPKPHRFTETVGRTTGGVTLLGVELGNLQITLQTASSGSQAAGS